MSFFEELKRRNVFRVGAAYVLMGWVALQGADFALDLFGAPNWVIQALSVTVAVGLPIALVLAWAFELTPEGVKRESEVDRDESITPNTGKKLDRVIIAVLALVIIFMVVERTLFAPAPVEPNAAESVVEETGPDLSKSIAVLPFADMSQAGDQQWFADGLAEEILNSLARTPDLKVTSRTSSFKYRESDLDVPQIGKELNVAHVLEGSVRQSGDRVRVTAQLIRADDGFHLWSQNYDRDQADMIAIQEDLAVQIAQALETSMDPQALAEMARMGTESVEAYQLFLQARQVYVESFLDADDAQTSAEMLALLDEALTLDNGFSAAHYLVSDVWRSQITPSRPDSGVLGKTTHEALNNFHKSISDAIQTASNNEDKQLYRAVQALVDMRLRDSTALLQEYLTGRPNDFYAWRLFTDLVWITHEPGSLNTVQAYHKQRMVFEPLNATEYLNLAFIKDDMREAVEVAREALQRWPGNPGLEYQAHRLLLWAGEVERARPLAARYPRESSNFELMSIRQACAEGRTDDAYAIFEKGRNGKDIDESTLWLALSMLSRYEEAEQLLKPMVADGIAYQLADIAGYPQFGPMSFPSLVAVFEREGLPLRPRVEVPFACPLPQPPSIAVLPFVNMSADADQEYFSDGITEEIINALTGIPDLKVAARTSVFAFKGREQDVREIGRTLDVEHVLEGSVRSDGEQLRITAQLIQVDDGFHLWSETFDRQRGGVFVVQEEIANAIASQLSETFSPETSVAHLPSIDIEGYDEYLQGLAGYRLRSEAGLGLALEKFTWVTENYPAYAPGWAGLAMTLDVIDDHANSESAALKALELEPDNVNALNALGAQYRDTFRWAKAEEMLMKAYTIDPGSAELLEDITEFFLSVGELEKALEYSERGYQIDPYLMPMAVVHSEALLGLGRYADVIAVLNAIAPGQRLAWIESSKLVPLALTNDRQAMLEVLQNMPAVEENREAFLAFVENPTDPDLVTKLNTIMLSSRAQVEYSDSLVAINLLQMHGYDSEVAQGIGTSIKAGDRSGQPEYWFLPHFEGVRKQPEFVGLLEQVNLPEYWDEAGWPTFCRRNDTAEGLIICE